MDYLIALGVTAVLVLVWVFLIGGDYGRAKSETPLGDRTARGNSNRSAGSEYMELNNNDAPEPTFRPSTNQRANDRN